MVKDTKKNANKKGGNSKNGKVLEVEDFFTSFLAKKIRNINKKLTHISELEKINKADLKSDQADMIARKSELLGHIDEQNEIKKMYLEAYSKKGEYEAHAEGTTEGAPQVEAKMVQVVDNSAQLAQVAKDAENKCCNRVTEMLSKLVTVTHLMDTQASVDQFSEESGLKSSDLSDLLNMHNQLVVRGANNEDHQQSVMRTFRAYVEQEAVRGTDNRSMPEMYNLVEDVMSNSAFANFVVRAPVVVVETAPVVEVKAPVAVEVKVESRKESAARKDSEAQQQLFMEDDSEDEHEVRENAPAPVVQAKVTVTEKTTVAAPKEEKKVEKKANVDSDDEEWHTAAKGGRQAYDPANPNPNYRGNNRGRGERGSRGDRGRGGRGRGGRGDYKKDGERRERREGDETAEYDGERRKYDGEKRPYTRGDGERGRGDRGRGGRGRGGRGRYNKDGERRPYDGERKAYRKQNEDGTPVEGGAPLKEVGTLDQPQVSVKVEVTETQE